MRATEEHHELQLLSIKRAAERLSCSRANLYALIKDGKLPVVQVGTRKGLRVDVRDLDAFIQNRKFRFAVPQTTVCSVRLKHLRT